MTIAKTASRSVAFKAARMSESALKSQDEVITRKPEGDETGYDHDKQSALDDIGYDADLYIFNQVVVQDYSFRLTFGWFTRDYYL